MARRMHEQKEYYWQGKGGPDVTLKKIISELLHRDLDKITRNPGPNDMTDVYQLQFDCYNDGDAIEGHSIIHVPHDEAIEMVFSMTLLLYDLYDENIRIDHLSTIDNSLIDNIEACGFAIYLRKIASNQPQRFDYS